MAFDYSGIIGTQVSFAAQYMMAYSDPSVYTFNSDGSTLLSAVSPQGALQDANTGFPGPITPANPVGAPGTFILGDIPGYQFTTYNAAAAVVELRQYNPDGTVSSIFIGGQVIDYNQIGFLVESLDGFRETGGGTYVGTLSGAFYLVTTDGTVLDTYNAAGNPIPEALSFPQLFEPLSFNFSTVPEPSMGLVIGLIAACVVGLRVLFGRNAARATA